ncbi:hypothetical protein ACHWQZ_G004363 [Mnemiopsis leidyi]
MFSYVTICVSLLSLSHPVLPSDFSPYTLSHGSPRSHRYVRQCHDKQGFTETFEVTEQNSENAPLRVKTFEDDIPGSSPHRFAYGHVAVVASPRDTLSVYEPDIQGSCTAEHTTQHFLSDSAPLHNCIYATNAGFFNLTTGNCLGNLYSDGRLVVNAQGIMNPNFGILRNGSIVVGYLTEEHIVNLDWVNLVQGIIWLVRQGKNYVNDAMQMECDDLQTTGDMERFVSTNSARTAIGHDKDGNVLLLHVEGKTYSPRGINLREFADLLIVHGFVNAVNLDGGSSTTVYYNNSIINYPSEHCTEENGAYRCQHLISSILCVHALCTCVHGTCVNNKCVCNPGYSGESCQDEIKCPGDCSGRGACKEGRCVCDSGWVGDECHVTCPEGYHGNQCNLKCICTHGNCNHVTGDCTCFAGWTGLKCDAVCPNSTWGQDCKNTCSDCTVHGTCDPQTGECNCSIGWFGKLCQVHRASTFGGLSTRELGILAVLIGLVALCLTSLSFNVYYCLKSRSKQNSRSSRGSSSRGVRSPRLPAADITAQEHVQRQIPIYREIQNINKKSVDDSFRMEIRGQNDTSHAQSRDVLEMIEKIQFEEDSISDEDDTALLLKR